MVYRQGPQGQRPGSGQRPGQGLPPRQGQGPMQRQGPPMRQGLSAAKPKPRQVALPAATRLFEDLDPLVIDRFITEQHLTVKRDRWGAHDRQITWPLGKIQHSIHIFVPEDASAADLVIELSVWLDEAGTRLWMDWPTFRRIPAPDVQRAFTLDLLTQAHRQANEVTEQKLRTAGKRTGLPG